MRQSLQLRFINLEEILRLGIKFLAQDDWMEDAISRAFKIKLIIYKKFHTILSFHSILSMQSLSAVEAICFRYIFLIQ